MIYIFWACRDTAEAREIIRKLLDERLIACASILPEVESIYRWKGKIEESRETKVILKTTPDHFTSIQRAIEVHCSYEVSEIVQVEVAACSPKYLAWVEEEVSLV